MDLFGSIKKKVGTRCLSSCLSIHPLHAKKNSADSTTNRWNGSASQPHLSHRTRTAQRPRVGPSLNEKNSDSPASNLKQRQPE